MGLIFRSQSDVGATNPIYVRLRALVVSNTDTAQAGSLLFETVVAGATAERMRLDRDNLVVGHTAASARLHTRGNSSSTGNALYAENSGATLLFSVQNDGYIDLGTLRPTRQARLSSDPGTANNGDIYYNTTTNKFRGYENGAWVNLI